MMREHIISPSGLLDNEDGMHSQDQEQKQNHPAKLFWLKLAISLRHRTWINTDSTREALKQSLYHLAHIEELVGQRGLQPIS